MSLKSSTNLIARQSPGVHSGSNHDVNIPSPTTRQQQRVLSKSLQSKLPRPPLHARSIRSYTFPLVALTATFAFLQHHLVYDDAYTNSSSSLPLTSSMSLQAAKETKRHNAPSDIFGPSPPAQAAAESTVMDELRLKKFDFGGGQGDPKHLGGFGSFDKTSTSPEMWSWMIQSLGVKSVLDVGCGRGWSTSWFLYHGVGALCVEGSHDAVSQNAVSSSKRIVEHDFTLGAWWPNRTYDVAWVTEFVQQVSLHHSSNYIPALSKAAMLFVSTPLDTGWHHVEIHSTDWWIQRFERFGWKYDSDLTKRARDKALVEAYRKPAPDGKMYNAVILASTLMVFHNPEVARLPQHAHLFPEPGCFKSKTGNGYNGSLVLRECATAAGVGLETKLDKSFEPLEITSTSDMRWSKRVQTILTLRRPLLPRSEQQHYTTGLNDEEEYLLSSGTKYIKFPPIDMQLNASSHAVGRIAKEWSQSSAIAKSSFPKIPVVLWPFLVFGPGNAESKQIEIDGVEQSPLLTLSNDMFDFDPNVIWVGDIGFGYPWEKWCQRYNELVVEAKQKRAKLGLPLQWPIYILNFSDGPSFQRCFDVEESIGPGMVKYTIRSIVESRDWDEEAQWVTRGQVLDLSSRGKTFQHASLIVRTDTVAALNKVLMERQHSLSAKIENMKRVYDITHFWPTSVAGNAGVGDVKSSLRTKVSQIITKMAADHKKYKVKNKPLSIYVGLAGNPSSAGRKGVVDDYILTLLKTKIIIVTQRDAWEDHYRLFESLISGAMVLCDRMLSLPEGLKNGTHLIEFESEADLIQKAMYYLHHDKERREIAHRGRRLSMARHRSWHRMEEIIFGRPLTVCQETDHYDCAYIVHANETMLTPTTHNASVIHTKNKAVLTKKDKAATPK
ncbi:hypothetical protein MPSEU_000446400 [Mayamaea pseudoterrestris]|nr:hypothetical protein MPSEU_000446400 [Mayamaea pseudoterrestris]